ncbi:hypothetical protein D3C80_2004620 [compost metagenome]
MFGRFAGDHDEDIIRPQQSAMPYLFQKLFTIEAITQIVITYDDIIFFQFYTVECRLTLFCIINAVIRKSHGPQHGSHDRDNSLCIINNKHTTLREC